MSARTIRRRARLMDAQGAPAPPLGKNEIPFIRVYPNYTKALQPIPRPREVYEKACQFIAHGGRYMIAIISDEEVKMVAGMVGQAGELVEMAAETCENGPMMLDAVDRLVRDSVAKMDVLQ